MNQRRDEFESWYDSYDKRTPQSPFDRELARKAWQAALESPQVLALRDALEGLLQLDEENHQRYAGDDDVCKEVREARTALAAMEKKQ